MFYTGAIYQCLYHCLYYLELYQYYWYPTCTNTIYYAIYNDIYAIIIVYAMNISYHHTNIKLLEANPTA